MEIVWKISEKDIKIVNNFYRQHMNNNFGGIRRGKIIGQEISLNYKWFNETSWMKIEHLFNKLQNNSTVENERNFAKFIMDNLKGFGPKQSRNLLQNLGILKYEIPIDSRIVRWLNNFGFPVKLSATALSDENYYNFIMDGFQQLCRESEIYPCVLDAVIFSSYDQDDWSIDQLIW
jgi:thermostable 8-oxoguanine DNA glycosylase